MYFCGLSLLFLFQFSVHGAVATFHADFLRIHCLPSQQMRNEFPRNRSFVHTHTILVGNGGFLFGVQICAFQTVQVVIIFQNAAHFVFVVRPSVRFLRVSLIPSM